ncbi:MAG: hypothetical protein ACI396_05615 [Acutalibacteraceae bacterium]
MKHLTVEEIMDFVSFDKLDEKTVSLAKKVNSHIMNCAECRKKVAAFQEVYDEMLRIGKNARRENMIDDDFANNLSKRDDENDGELFCYR